MHMFCCTVIYVHTTANGCQLVYGRIKVVFDANCYGIVLLFGLRDDLRDDLQETVSIEADIEGGLLLNPVITPVPGDYTFAFHNPQERLDLILRNAV